MFLILLSLFEGEFFLVGVDAASWGRGATGLAYPTTGYHNPASALVIDPCVYFTGSKLFGNLANFLSGGVSLNRDDYGLGLHFILHLVGDISYTIDTWDDENGNGVPDPGEEIYEYLKSSFSSEEGAVFSTYSRWVGGFSTGIGLKFIYKKIHDAVAVGAGTDIGIIYQKEELSIGAAVKDITTSPLFWEGRTEHIAPSYLLGFGFKRKIGKIPVLLEVDLSQDDYGFNHNFGTEVEINEWLKIRGGFFNDQLTTGFGIKKLPFLVDYALNLHPDLLISHRVSLLYKL
jgi:hypothetical protein